MHFSCTINLMSTDYVAEVKNILIIDDDPIIIESLLTQLKDHNYKVDYLTESDKALELINKYNYDLILTDINMKPINGIKLLEMIRKDQPDLPVIILTGHNDKELRDHAIKSGSNDYLLKPIRKKDLLEAIETVGKYYI